MPHWMFPLISLLILWDVVWKLIALWRAARNDNLGWFIFIAILNTAGILPIVYLLTHPSKDVLCGNTQSGK